MIDLPELAAACERHSGETDPELNQRIHDVLPEPKCVEPPNYCKSLDAAMTLVPEGLSVTLYAHPNEAHCDVYYGHPSKGVVAEAVGALTPALALCAAALRALREHIQSNMEGERS